MKKIYLIALLVVATHINIMAQQTFEPAALPPQIKAAAAKGEIKVDGILSENDWMQAEGITGFTQIEPYQGDPSKNLTSVKVLYSDQHLYIGVFCSDTLGKKAVRVPDMMRDFNWRAHDTFAIAINGFSDKRNSMSFATNPYGTQKDYLSFDDIFFDGDWNGLWKVRTSITDLGWYAEFEIPWKTLRYRKDDAITTQQWEINFLRLRRASNEIAVWSLYPRSFGFNRMEYAGMLQGIEPPPPSTNIQVNPYSLINYNKQTKSDGTEADELKVKVGGEIKWVVNTSTTADLTINTDFAQADADVQVNNVSRFSILFPEKRQFFLENASLFSPNVLSGKIGGSMQFLPFFSRRVGLSETGNPLSVDAGVRVVSRTVNQSLGVMGIRQGSLDTLSGANIFVGRYSRNLTTKTRLGTIATLKSSDGNSNLLGGVDGFFRFDAAQSLNVLVSGSSTSGSNETGIGAYAQYNYTSNKLIGYWTQTILTKDFQPALGFVSRTDVIGTTPGITANLRGRNLPLPKIIRSYQPGVAANFFHKTSTGQLIEREFNATPLWFETQAGGYYGLSASAFFQNLLTDFRPLGITINSGKYEYNRFSLSAGSDPSRKISHALQYDFGDYYNGQLQSATASLSLVPLPHISVKASVNRNWFSNVGSELGDKVISLYTLQGRFALNPRIQLIGLYQRNSNNQESYNVRFAWEFKPLSYFYLVMNSRESMISDVRSLEQQGIFKISYLRQF